MKKLLLILCCAMLLSGCTKSKIVAGGKLQPDMETREGIQLDWQQVGDTLTEDYVESGDFIVGEQINFTVNSEEKLIDLVLRVRPDTTAEEAVEWATAVMKAFGSEVAVQDFSYTMPEADTYGSFFDEYSVDLHVMPTGTLDDPDKWIVDMSIPAGSHEPIKAK